MAPEYDIQAIVDAVLARLQPPRASTTAKTECGCHDKTTAAAPCGCQHAAKSNSGVLSLHDRVVSVATLENRLEGVRRVVLAERAVVTPAARDLLRARSIETAFAQPAVGAARASSIVLATAELSTAAARHSAAALAATIANDSLPVERIADSGLSTVVAELADHAARGGRLAVLLTSKPDAAACLANRRRGVRAVACRDHGATAAWQEIGANLLAIDAALPIFQAKRLIEDFWRGAPRAVPTYMQDT